MSKRESAEALKSRAPLRDEPVRIGHFKQNWLIPFFGRRGTSPSELWHLNGRGRCRAECIISTGSWSVQKVDSFTFVMVGVVWLFRPLCEEDVKMGLTTITWSRCLSTVPPRLPVVA